MDRVSVAQVPVEPQTVEERLFSDHVRGLLTDEEYYDNNAVLVGQKTELYRPMPYARLPLPAEEYCRRRVAGAIVADSVFFDSIAKWITSNQRAAIENEKNFSTLKWALKRCMASHLSLTVSDLKATIARHEQNLLPAVTSSALDVFRKDQVELKKGGS